MFTNQENELMSKIKDRAISCGYISPTKSQKLLVTLELAHAKFGLDLEKFFAAPAPVFGNDIDELQRYVKKNGIFKKGFMPRFVRAGD